MMSRSSRLALKSVVVVAMAGAALFAREERAFAAACDTTNYCTDNCENIPPSFATTCSLCFAIIECIWAGSANCGDPESEEPWCYPPCTGQYVYSCAWES